MSEHLRNLRRRARTAATLVVMAGLIATAAGVQATAAPQDQHEATLRDLARAAENAGE